MRLRGGPSRAPQLKRPPYPLPLRPAPTPLPTASIASAQQQPQTPSYTAELTKKYLAENFLLPGMVAVSAFRAGRIDGTSRGTGHHFTPYHVSNAKKSLGDEAWFARLPYVGWGAGFQAMKPPSNDLRLRQGLNL